MAGSRPGTALDLTWPTVDSAVKRLEKLGIAREVTGRARDRLYAYQAQLDILNADIEAR